MRPGRPRARRVGSCATAASSIKARGAGEATESPRLPPRKTRTRPGCDQGSRGHLPGSRRASERHTSRAVCTDPTSDGFPPSPTPVLHPGRDSRTARESFRLRMCANRETPRITGCFESTTWWWASQQPLLQSGIKASLGHNAIAPLLKGADSSRFGSLGYAAHARRMKLPPDLESQHDEPAGTPSSAGC